VIARPHAPVFTDDSGVRRVTVQWGGRVIALTCVALWAALALTLGTQVSLPGLDRLPSLSDDFRRALLSDTRLTAVPDVDRRQLELNRVSGVDVPRALPRPAEDSSEARTAVVPQRSIKDRDRTEAVVKGSGTPDNSAKRSDTAKPDAAPANPKSRKPAHASAPPKAKPNPHANPNAKAAVAQAKARGEAAPSPDGTPRKAKTVTPAPRIDPNLKLEKNQRGQAQGQRPADPDNQPADRG
jgi:hypothetical protein